MRKILIVTITPNSAVDILAEQVQKYNEHLEIKILPFHPKRYSRDDLILFQDFAKWADVIDFEYWKNMVVLFEQFPWLKDKTTILTHHNPYNLHEKDWSKYNLNAIVVKNKTQQLEIPDSIHIHHGVDTEIFKYNEDYDYDKKVVGMVANRMEGTKGIVQVAKACKDLGYKFLLVGHVSKSSYFKEIMDVGADIDFRQDQHGEDLIKAYYDTSIHICNSIDNFESGTMPILEAMACGIPVITRKIGHIPENFTGDNMIVRNGDPDDIEDLKGEIRNLMENKELRKKIRENGWKTATHSSAYRMAKKYAKLYNDVAFETKSLVSVITATYNRVDQIEKIINSLENQDYKNIELIVCDDNSTDGTESLTKEYREKVSFPIKYISTFSDGYNLAQARNLGIIESEGDLIMFLDSRLIADNTAISSFVKNIGRGKVWLFGDKGANKRNFVENFSMIRRKHIINGGMFNERINKYGGMSQEIRERFSSQDFVFKYIPEAKAVEALSSQKMSTKRNDIMEMKDLLWKLNK